MSRGSGSNNAYTKVLSRSDCLSKTNRSRVVDLEIYKALIDEHFLPETRSRQAKYINAIDFYAHNGAAVNQRLLDIYKSNDEKDIRGAMYTAGKIDAAMRLSSTAITVLRGMRFDEHMVIEPGSKIDHQGFIGTTLSLKEAKRFSNPKKQTTGYVFELSVPAGTPYIPLVKYMSNYHFDKYGAEEAEILWGRNHTIVVDEISKELKAAKGKMAYCKAHLEKLSPEEHFVLPDKYVVDL